MLRLPGAARPLGTAPAAYPPSARKGKPADTTPSIIPASAAPGAQGEIVMRRTAGGDLTDRPGGARGSLGQRSGASPKCRPPRGRKGKPLAAREGYPGASAAPGARGETHVSLGRDGPGSRPRPGRAGKALAFLPPPVVTFSSRRGRASWTSFPPLGGAWVNPGEPPGARWSSPFPFRRSRPRPRAQGKAAPGAPPEAARFRRAPGRRGKPPPVSGAGALRRGVLRPPRPETRRASRRWCAPLRRRPRRPARWPGW